MRHHRLSAACLLMTLSIACGEVEFRPPIDFPASTLDRVAKEDRIAARFPPGLLVEPEVTRESDQLLLRSRQLSTFCAARQQVDQLPEPDPAEVNDLLFFAWTSYQSALSVDPKAEFVDKRSPPDRPRRITPPPEVIESLETLRRAFYAYLMRLLIADHLRQGGTLTRAQFRTHLNVAFLELSGRAPTEAERLLRTYQLERCP